MDDDADGDVDAEVAPALCVHFVRDAGVNDAVEVVVVIPMLRMLMISVRMLLGCS